MSTWYQFSCIALPISLTLFFVAIWLAIGLVSRHHVTPRVFISYRHADKNAAIIAYHFYRDLGKEFGYDNVFRDDSSMQLSDEFPAILAHAVNSSDAVVAVIGKEWAGEDKQNVPPHLPRILNPKDWVHQEVKSGIVRKRLLIALVRGETVPKCSSLLQEYETQIDSVMNLADMQDSAIGVTVEYYKKLIADVEYLFNNKLDCDLHRLVEECQTQIGFLQAPDADAEAVKNKLNDRLRELHKKIFNGMEVADKIKQYKVEISFARDEGSLDLKNLDTLTDKNALVVEPIDVDTSGNGYESGFEKLIKAVYRNRRWSSRWRIWLFSWLVLFVIIIVLVISCIGWINGVNERARLSADVKKINPIISSNLNSFLSELWGEEVDDQKLRRFFQRTENGVVSWEAVIDSFRKESNSLVIILTGPKKFVIYAYFPNPVKHDNLDEGKKIRFVGRIHKITTKSVQLIECYFVNEDS